MDFVVVIPTYQRAHILETHTLSFLERAGIPPSRIQIFVVDTPSERDAYQRFADRGHPLHYGPLGLHHMRNFIHQQFAEDAHILCMDDDIRTLLRMRIDPTITDVKSSKRYPLHDDVATKEGEFDTWCQRAFARLHEEGASLFGIYPVKNGYFMKSLPEITTDLRFCVGAFWGMRNRRDMQIQIEEKEDVERTLLCWIRDSKILRFNHIAPVTKYYVTQGGMQAHGKDRKESAKQSCAYLLQTYPTWCSLYTSKKSGHYEIRLRSTPSQH